MNDKQINRLLDELKDYVVAIIRNENAESKDVDYSYEQICRKSLEEVIKEITNANK